MEEVRQLVQEEGREARNIVAFHVSVDPPGVKASSRKAVRGTCPVEPQNGKQTSGARVRSASTGRDKRSELQARYWGLLFGNLQRAVGEIYSTVEAHENLSECQEVILVLENYTRDFKSLCEWFRLKWEYDNTPPPQRPLSLAWEVRKTSPAKPELRKTQSSKSSPSISGKSSPCMSGKNSPCPGKISPSVSCHKISPGSSSGKTSPRIPSACLSPKQKGDTNAFFNTRVEKIDEGIILSNVCEDSNKRSEIKIKKEKEATGNEKNSVECADVASSSARNVSGDCKVREVFTIMAAKGQDSLEIVEKLPKVEIGTATEFPSLPTPRKAIVMRKNSNKNIVQSDDGSGKISDKSNPVIKRSADVKRKVLPVHVKHTTDILDALENEHLKAMNEKRNSDITKPIVVSNDNSVIENVQKIIAKNLDLSNVNTTDMITVEDIEKSIIDANKNSNLNDTEPTSAHIHVINKHKTDVASTDIKTDAERTDKCDPDKNANLTKPAYSQAASKPKSTTSTSIQTKVSPGDSKSVGVRNSASASSVPAKVTPLQSNRLLSKSGNIDVLLTRSKTIADIKQGPCRKAELKNSTRNSVKQNTNRNAGSYPFNLTVGRGKIFDGNPGSRTVNSISRPDQLKPKLLSSINNHRPNTLILKKDVSNSKSVVATDQSDKKIDPNTTVRDFVPSTRLLQPSGFQSLDSMYSSSETIVNSKVELSHVESNESIRTLCPENELNIYNASFAGSVEVLNIIDDSGGVDSGGNDGWLTVKSRRLAKNGQSKKSSSHWSNRYNQPSATASLPTLNMIESPKEGTSKLSDFVKHDIAVESKTQLKVADKKKPEQKQKKEKKFEGKKNVHNKPNLDMIRQKSDVTGLKTKNVKDRYKQTSLDVKKSFQNFKLDFIDNKYLEYAKKQGQDTSDYESKSKKFKNKFTKMHFSSEDLSDCKATHDCESISDVKSKTFPPSKNFDNSNINEKSKVTLHLSLESLNSDSYTSNSLEHIMSANEKLTASEISIDRDSLKQNPLHKSSDVYDGDNDEETKDSSVDNLDTEANEIEMMTNQIEENERKMDLALDWQSEEDQRKLSEEEELLNQQIQELQQGSDLDIDTETDDTETDGEILCEEDEDTTEETSIDFQKETLRGKQSRYPSIEGNTGDINSDQNQNGIKTFTVDDEMSLEDRYEPILSSMSWGERMDVLATLESLVSRHPGRAQQLHAKLSHSMRRRGSLQETLRRYQAKQARAEHHRTALQKERSNKLHQLLARVQDVTAAKVQLIEEKRLRMEHRLQRAAENRDQRLKDIVRKAHDEDEKLREIAFIKQLEAENKRHDFLEQCREQTSRLREVRADRMRRLEEKAAKEAAVEERRKALETERKIRLDKMRESRRQREERVGRQQMQREKERAQLAEEKARGRSERLSALLAAQAATAQALRRRIYLKQRETARRHQQTISLIRQRALELSSQRPDHLNTNSNINVHEWDSGTKIKSNHDVICRLKSSNDSNRRHNGMNGSSHAYNSLMPLQEDGDKCVTEGKDENRVSASRERHKALKKKLKKIKQRMITKGQEYESTYQFPACDAFSAKSKMSRSINQIASIVQRQTLNSNSNGAPKNQNIIIKSGLESKKESSVHSSLSDLSKNSSSKGEGFVISGGGNLNQLDRFLGELSRIMEKQINPQEKLAWQKLNGFSILNDILFSGINEKENFTEVSSKTLITASNLYKMACQNCHQNCDYVILSNKILHPIDLMLQRLQVSVTSGVPCPLATSLQQVLRSALKHSTAAVAPRIQDLVSYVIGGGLVELVSQFCSCAEDPAAAGACELIDSSFQLLATLTERCAKDAQGEACSRLSVALRTTEVGGCVRGVCCALASCGPPSESALALANAALKLLRATAEADLSAYQDGLSGGAALQFRHMASRLLRHTSSETSDTTLQDRLLGNLLPAIGYFAVNNEHNQNLLTAGSSPCVVQQLSTLPFRYFSGNEHSQMLLPVLIACSTNCDAAVRLLKQEVSQQLLDDFKNSETGKKSKLIGLMTSTPEEVAEA